MKKLFACRNFMVSRPLLANCFSLCDMRLFVIKQMLSLISVPCEASGGTVSRKALFSALYVCGIVGRVIDAEIDKDAQFIVRCRVAHPNCHACVLCSRVEGHRVGVAGRWQLQLDNQREIMVRDTAWATNQQGRWRCATSVWHTFCMRISPTRHLRDAHH